MSSSTPINKENSINVLANSVRLAQKNGAFNLRDAALLADAIDFLNPEVKEKPKFDSPEDPEIVAVNMLLQGVQKGQAHSGEWSYGLDDARLLYKIIEFWMKELGRGVTQNVTMSSGTSTSSKDKKSAKNAAASAIRQQQSSDNAESDEGEDEDEGIRPLQINKKGKERM